MMKHDEVLYIEMYTFCDMNQVGKIDNNCDRLWKIRLRVMYDKLYSPYDHLL
jgi:hypothetical protein